MKNWRDEINNIKVPIYLEEDLDELFQYLKEGNTIMYKVQIDDCITSLNNADQERELTPEEIKFIRKKSLEQKNREESGTRAIRGEK